jgi:hypothetical protein
MKSRISKSTGVSAESRALGLDKSQSHFLSGHLRDLDCRWAARVIGRRVTALRDGNRSWKVVAASAGHYGVDDGGRSWCAASREQAQQALHIRGPARELVPVMVGGLRDTGKCDGHSHRQRDAPA